MPIEINEDGFTVGDQSGPEQRYMGLVLPGRGQPALLGTPSKPTDSGVAQGDTQASKRFSDTFFDDCRHPKRFPRGRPWTGEREIGAMANRGQLPGFVTTDLMQGEYVTNDGGFVDRNATSQSVWFAPWVPLPKYFRFNYQRKSISFNRQGFLLDEQRGYDDYFEAAAKIAPTVHARVDYGVVPSFGITSVLGFPTRYLEIAKAFIAGDPWLLGYIDEPNEKLAKILGFNNKGMRVLSYNPDPEPVVTAEAVLATPQNELLKMIADMQMKLATLEAERAAEKTRRSEHGKKVQAGRLKAQQARKTSSVPAEAAS